MSARWSSGCPHELLGGHVAELALDLPLPRYLHPTARLRDPEVDQVSVSVGAHQDVVRRDVSVNDAQRVSPFVSRFVRRVQPVEDADHDGRGDRYGNHVLCRPHCPEQPRERLPGDVLHDDEELAFSRDHVERGDHVRMANARCEPRLVQEHGDELRVLGERGVQPLDGHGSREADRSEEPPGYGWSPYPPTRSPRGARSGRSCEGRAPRRGRISRRRAAYRGSRRRPILHRPPGQVAVRGSVKNDSARLGAPTRAPSSDSSFA